jgi:hypothetical protein
MAQGNEAVTEKIDVYVPGSKIPGYADYCPIARFEGYIQADKTVRVRLRDGTEIDFERKATLNAPGFLVLQIGGIDPDYTEHSAAVAIYQSLNSLFAGCGKPVDFERMRTTVELSAYMKKYRSKYSHIVLIGHGVEEGLPFLDRPDAIAGQELSGFLGGDANERAIQMISLCCHSGGKMLSKAISNAPGVTEVIAPTSTFDMRWAVHFVTGYFLHLYLEDLSTDEAVRRSIVNKDSTPMCIWRGGTLAASCAANY